MEAYIAGTAALIGLMVSFLLVGDAISDVRVVDTPRRWRIARNHLISEVVRGVVQLLFFIAVLLSLTNVLRSAIVWLLIAVPVILAIASIHSYLEKRDLLRDDE